MVQICVSLICGYTFEYLCFKCFRADWPILSHLAGLIQFPTSLLAMNVPPPSVQPDAKAIFMRAMFLVQGALFSTVCFLWAKKRI